MPNVQDPYTQIYERLLLVLQNDPVVSSLVRAGNWIKFDSQPIKPWKSNIQPGDMPEVLIEPVTGMDKQSSDSISAETTVVWSIKCATNDPRLFWLLDDGVTYTGVFALKWAMLVALDTAGDGLASLNTSPLLPSLTFCRVTRITASVKSPFDPAGNPVSEARGTDGWTILITLTTILDIQRLSGVLQLPGAGISPITTGGFQVTSGGG